MLAASANISLQKGQSRNRSLAESMQFTYDDKNKRSMMLCGIRDLHSFGHVDGDTGAVPLLSTLKPLVAHTLRGICRLTDARAN